MTQNVLHISPDFNYACGVSKHVYLLLKELKKNSNYKMFFITNGGDSLGRLIDLGINPTIIDFNRGNRNVYKLFKNVLSLYIFCKKNKINAIHTHHRYPELISYLVSLFLHIKTVSTVHSLLNNLKFSSFRSEKVIAVSNAVKENLINNFNVDAKRIVVMYNFIEPFIDVKPEQKERFLKQHNLSKSDRIMLFAGRINEIKGSDILLSTFDEISEIRNDIKLMLVGCWELSATYKNDIQKSSKIILVDPSSEVAIYYSISTMVVSPSRMDSFPFIMLEAGSANKPFIGGKTGGIAEFIEDGVNGLLVEPGNTEDLIRKINYILDNPDNAKAMAANLNKKVKKIANAEEYIKVMNDLYLSKHYTC